MKKRTVLLDTNFLLTPGRLKLDVFQEINKVVAEPHELAVLDKNVEELKKLGEINKNKRVVNIAQGLLEKNQVKIIKTKSFLKDIELHGLNDADDYIVKIVKSSPEQFIVATQDKELKKRLRNLGVKVIFIRKKSFVELEG